MNVMNVKCDVCNSSDDFHYCLDCRKSKYESIEDLVRHQKKHGHTGGHYILQLPDNRRRRSVRHNAAMVSIDDALVNFQNDAEAAEAMVRELQDDNALTDAYTDAVVDSDDELDDGAQQRGQRRNFEEAFEV